MHDAIPQAIARSALHGLALPDKPDCAIIRDAGPATRYVFRGAPELIRQSFSLTLPTTPCRSETNGDRAALWLGPDEWLVIAPPEMSNAIATAGAPSALVDVSHRNCGLIATGRSVEALLNAGCPLDLDQAAFPVGMCSRTLFGKAEIVLWRTAADSFRIEVWRSFAPYVVELLTEAIHDID